MSGLWSAAFWRATAERAIATAAQSALLVLGAEQINVVAVTWVEVGGFAAGGAALAVLKALVAQGVTGDGPSLSHAEVVAPAPRHLAPGDDV